MLCCWTQGGASKRTGLVDGKVWEQASPCMRRSIEGSARVSVCAAKRGGSSSAAAATPPARRLAEACGSKRGGLGRIARRRARPCRPRARQRRTATRARLRGTRGGAGPAGLRPGPSRSDYLGQLPSPEVPSQCTTSEIETATVERRESGQSHPPTPHRSPQCGVRPMCLCICVAECPYVSRAFCLAAVGR